MIVFSLLYTAWMCVFYGIVITIAIMAILYFVLRLMGEGIVKSVPFFVTGVFLFILLSIQMSLMMGAVEANSAVEAAGMEVTRIVENYQGVFDATESQQLFDRIKEEIPIIGLYISDCDFSGNDATTIAESMVESMHDYFNSYIWSRVFWSLGMIVLACIIAMMFDKGKGRTAAPRRSSGRSSSPVTGSRRSRYR